MLFDKNEGNISERIIYKTKPNMFLGCKKAIYGFILLAIVLIVSPMAIQFIGEMQVYLISYVKLSLTRYAAIAFFVIILFIILYIIWQLIGWYSLEYTLTDSKIIIKSGVLSTKKNYMPYVTIQDINTSQSIIAKLLNVGSISVFSAYDNNQLVLSNISNPSKVEEIIFSNMMGYQNFQKHPQQRFVERHQNIENNYLGRNDYYDDFEPITPIAREKELDYRRDYEYYPENIDAEKSSYNAYEYEPYDDNIRYEPREEYSKSSYYDEVRNDYSYEDNDYYQNNDSEIYYNDGADNFSQNDSEDMGENMDSSEKVIRRHFDKFKK